MRESLRHQKPVEWIAVVKWKRRDPARVIDLDREQIEFVRRQLLGDESFERIDECQ